MVATEIYERYQLGGVLADLFDCSRVAVVEYLQTCNGQMLNDTNEHRKSYNIDTNETFIVTRLNDKPLNTVTTVVQSVHPSPAHKHEDGNATHQLHCQ